LGKVNSPKRRVQLSAINGLGTLGDARAIAALEKFTMDSKEGAERSAAERAVATLRDTKKPSAEVGTLRTEVLNLQKENRDLRKEFDDLKKKIEALSPKSGKSPEPPKGKKR
jgi:aminopeptidase N